MRTKFYSEHFKGRDHFGSMNEDEKIRLKWIIDKLLVKRYPLVRGWVGLRAGLDTEDRGKILCLCRDRTPVVQSLVNTNAVHIKERSHGIVPPLCDNRSASMMLSYKHNF
jgi:hypothetical protein